MADLFNKQINETYQGLLKSNSNGVIGSSLSQITDGRGNGSQLYLSTSTIHTSDQTSHHHVIVLNITVPVGIQQLNPRELILISRYVRSVTADLSSLIV